MTISRYFDFFLIARLIESNRIVTHLVTHILTKTQEENQSFCFRLFDVNRSNENSASTINSQHRSTFLLLLLILKNIEYRL